MSCSDRWRESAMRRPASSNRERGPRRSTIVSGDRERNRAAASSSARGSPSRRRHSSATAAAFSAVNANPGRAAIARSTSSCTAGAPATSSRSVTSSGASSSGAICHTTSPGSPSGSRDVASTWTPWHRMRIRSTSRTTASRRCSQLSRTSSWRLDAKTAKSVSSTLRSCCCCTSSAVATAAASAAGSRTAASSTTAAPSSKSSRGHRQTLGQRGSCPPRLARRSSPPGPRASPGRAARRSSSRPTNGLGSSATGRRRRHRGRLAATSRPGSIGQHLLLQLSQRRGDVEAQLVTEQCDRSSPARRRASACRPFRYSATIS